nr:MAG TPA: hypothetical protein [Caudoviricetes sp.]
MKIHIQLFPPKQPHPQLFPQHLLLSGIQFTPLYK